MSFFNQQKSPLPSHSKAVPSSAQSASQPINYEEYLEANHGFIDKDLASILLFPADEIQLVEIKKKFSTIEQLKPECEVDVDHNINDCLRSYNSNYKCIVKK